ncbi:hypothetical protein KAT24_00500 [Candidatus Pacearchaeota archaeon]|nr:hypothetical protein [Candidatus Pacearchaeota archaeon]
MDEEKKEGEGDNYRKSEEDNYEKPKELPKEPSKIGQSLTDKLRGNPFIVSTLICGVLAVLLLVAITSGGITGKVVSEEEAGENLIEFLNTVADSEVKLISIEEDGNFYQMIIEFKGQEMPVYVTKDGLYYTTNLVPIKTDSSSEDEKQDILKSDKPVVELFIMTHCPYGTQAEKGIIPVIKLLGDSIDFELRFCDYAMHDKTELDEQLNQYCIQEEQNEKFLDYLECFLKDGDRERCLTEIGIDKINLDSCVKKTDSEFKVTEKYNDKSTWLNGRFPLFDIHKDLNDKYDIGGSPSLVINGQIVSSARSPAAYLETICQAFNDAPAECDNVLSNATPSPMWGWDDSGASTTAQC